MDNITITVPGQPVAKGRPIAGRAFGTNFTTMRTPPKTLNYENFIKNHAVDAMNGEPPMEGAMAAEVMIVLPLLKSFSKKKRELALAGALRPTTRPDIDNYLKSCLDGIDGIVIGDDAQFTDIVIKKRYGEMPRLIINVKKVFGNETFPLI